MAKTTRLICIIASTPTTEGNTLRVYSLRQLEVEEDFEELLLFEGFTLRKMKKECLAEQKCFAVSFFKYRDSRYLLTDTPGKCMRLSTYKKHLERKYDENAELLSVELSKLAAHRQHGRQWVYITSAGSIIFHTQRIQYTEKIDALIPEPGMRTGEKKKKTVQLAKTVVAP